MITLVIGTPDSGKSALAETLAMESKCRTRYYLATMNVCDEESRYRVNKHRKAREGKGFLTLEIPYGVDRALEVIQEPTDSVILLECISNLVGNEMHDNPERALYCRPGAADPDAFLSQLMDDVKRLAAGVEDLIIVTNAYEADTSYDEETMLYIELCNKLNHALQGIADVTKDVRGGKNP